MIVLPGITVIFSNVFSFFFSIFLHSHPLSKLDLNSVFAATERYKITTVEILETPKCVSTFLLGLCGTSFPCVRKPD